MTNFPLLADTARLSPHEHANIKTFTEKKEKKSPNIAFKAFNMQRN